MTIRLGLAMGCLCGLFAASATHSEEPAGSAKPEFGKPRLYRQVEVPQKLLADAGFAGDVRIGDLTGDGQVDFVVFRSTDGDAKTDGGMKPCFIGAFTVDGEILWRAGQGGEQPARPGPVTLYDVDGDGCDEVICQFVEAESSMGSPYQLEDTTLQIRDGQTGRIIQDNAPEELRRARGDGPNWYHQRILVANLRGTARPRDFVMKLGSTLLAFDDQLQTLWTYDIPWSEYGRHSAYIPAVGDLTGDGRDEVNGGYYLLDPDGSPRWEGELGPHMDSVAIVPWDAGRMRAIASGGGHVLDADGNPVLKLGSQKVPHGQEVRVANFAPDQEDPVMIIRYRGHQPNAMVVATDGRILTRLELNDTPNHTGMEMVYWAGSDQPALLYNGGQLWRGDGRRFAVLKELPEPAGPSRMGWYHCIPANVCCDEREELVLYNPWDRFVWVFTPTRVTDEAWQAGFEGYRSTPRQYNVRLMD